MIHAGFDYAEVVHGQDEEIELGSVQCVLPCLLIIVLFCRKEAVKRKE